MSEPLQLMRKVERSRRIYGFIAGLLFVAGMVSTASFLIGDRHIEQRILKQSEENNSLLTERDSNNKETIAAEESIIKQLTDALIASQNQVKALGGEPLQVVITAPPTTTTTVPDQSLPTPTESTTIPTPTTVQSTPTEKGALAPDSSSGPLLAIAETIVVLVTIPLLGALQLVPIPTNKP